MLRKRRVSPEDLVYALELVFGLGLDEGVGLHCSVSPISTRRMERYVISTQEPV